MKSDEPKGKKEPKKESIQKKISEKFENLRKNEKMEEFYHYATSNTRDVVVYALLLVALILLIFVPFWGGLIIGIVGGIYFADELLAWVKDLNHFVDREGLNRSIILGGVFLAFFIVAPAIFLGAAAAVGVKKLVMPK